MASISEKLNQKLQSSGGISSSDVQQLVEEENEEKAGEQAGKSMSETSTVKAENPADNDTAMRLATAEMDRKNFFFGLMGAVDAQKHVKITPADKQAFVDAIIANGRMTADYSFFNNKFGITIRSRTYEEARAAMHFASSEARSTTQSRSEFDMRLRAMLMSMQVAWINGVQYKPASELGPLFRTTGEDGKPVDPPWLARVSDFENLPEAVFEAVWQCIFEFESKYWTMMRNARNQDFWLPG